MLILCAAQLIFVAAFQMVSIALPDIQADLDVGDSALQWVNSALALALAATLLPAGRLVDRLGGKVVFQVGAAGLVLTSLAAAASRSTGGATGVVVGGGLLSAAGWPALFLLVAVAAAPVVFVSRRLPSSAGDPGRPLDLVGAALAALTMTAAVLGLVQLTSGSLIGAALIGLAALLTLALVAVERRVAEPLIPLGIVARRPVAGVCLVSVLHAAVPNTGLYFFAIYMQGLDGRSAAATGLAFVPCNLGLVAESAAGGWLIPRLHPARTAALGLGIVAVGHLATARLPASGGYLTAFLPGIVLLGLGLGISQVAIATAMTSAVPTDYAGFASSTLSATSQLGTAVGLAILVGVAAVSGGDLADRVTGYRWVYAVAAAIAIAAIVLAPFLLRPSAANNRAERTSAARPVGHPAR